MRRRSARASSAERKSSPAPSSPRKAAKEPVRPSKMQDMKQRVISGIFMGVGLAAVVYGGHVFLGAMIFVFQIYIAKVRISVWNGQSIRFFVT